MVPLPNLISKLTDNLGRIIPGAWVSYLQQFTQAPPNFMEQSLSGPFNYTAVEPGTIAISGGAVSSIRLTRGRVTIDLGITPVLIPLAINDTINIEYAVAPTINFIPSYGQNTTAA